MNSEKSAEEIELETAKIQQRTARMKKHAQTRKVVAYTLVAGAVLIDAVSRRK